MTENNFNGMTVAEGVIQLEANFTKHFGSASSSIKADVIEHGFNHLQGVEGMTLGGMEFIPFIDEQIPSEENAGQITYFSWLALVIIGWLESISE